MNEIVKIYNGENFRIEMIDGNPWFVAQDVCNVLEIKDVRQAVEKLDEDEKLSGVLYQSGQKRKMWLVNEFGLYNLVLRSNKLEANQFRRWITHEVIPSIRSTGSYCVQDSKCDLTKCELTAGKMLDKFLSAYRQGFNDGLNQVKVRMVTEKKENREPDEVSEDKLISLINNYIKNTQNFFHSEGKIVLKYGELLKYAADTFGLSQKSLKNTLEKSIYCKVVHSTIREPETGDRVNARWIHISNYKEYLG